ncbi:MAG: VTT domain-containing protein, partial [Candidatus Cloacimonetes bacterium]|nr:VTT domain-containing protein [Candidatus Cloacimonadota bacterium]
ELIVIVAAKRYGVLVTALVAGGGLFVGSVTVFYIGWYIKERFARFFSRKKLAAVQERLKRHENLLLLIRILPYNPADIIAYAAGILKVRPRKFVLLALATSFVRTAALAWMGAHLDNWQQAARWASVLLLSAAASYVLVFWRRKQGQGE